jgi:deoxyribodipyrimidine photo-lyase
VLIDLVKETCATEVHASAAVEPSGAALEAELRDALAAGHAALHSHRGALLFEPGAVMTKKNKPFQVFTPFWRACLKLPEPAAPLTIPANANFFAGPLASDDLADWALMPSEPDWAAGFTEFWTPGESGAHERLDAFLEESLAGYPERRDRPGLDATSGLSPYLHFGELSPRQVWYVVSGAMAARPGMRRGGEAYLRQLGWREFSSYLLHHWPTLPAQPFRPEFGNFPWRDDSRALACWQQGRTGYPIVDAGMRQLWQTGWMHNRVRMVVASFLVKHLLIPWQDGAAWFWDTLVDADLANNAASWQWVAGSGADAAPYFRIFNPILQGKKFDPKGDYVRRWVPELAGLPAAHIHTPWDAPAELLAEAGLRIGTDYPAPIVDHAAARERALAAYAKIKRRK